MNIHPDFEELLLLLEDHHVEYMIVGGYAVAFHGYPHFTHDIDIFYDSGVENITRIRRALIAFGFNEKEVPEEVFRKKGNILTFGIPPSRVDLINEIDGVTFEDAKPNSIRGNYGKVKVTFIGFCDLIKNKTATARPKDKLDAEELTQR